MKALGTISAGLILVGGFILVLGIQAVKNYNLYFIITGMIIGGIGLILLTIINKKEEKTSKNEFDIWKTSLEKKGIKILVDFNNCEIKSNNYREEVIQDVYSRNKYGIMDRWAGNDPAEFKNILQSVIIYKAEVNGISRTFMSPIIPKDEISLGFLLADKETTIIYADKIDMDNYYFDLEFLWKE